MPEPHSRPDDIPMEEATVTFAPNVPPPITRKHPVRLVVHMDSTVEVMNVSPRHKYPFWTFNGHAPGPFIRARVGDTLQVQLLWLPDLVLCSSDSDSFSLCHFLFRLCTPTRIRRVSATTSTSTPYVLSMLSVLTVAYPAFLFMLG